MRQVTRDPGPVAAQWTGVFGDLDLSALEFVVCAVAAAGGAVVQALLGFGYALVVVPALLVIAPDAVPATALVVALPMVTWVAWAERRAIDRPGFWRMSLARIPGTVLGAIVLGLVGTRAIATLAGALLLLAVVFTGLRGARRASPALEVAAGFGSGAAGTVAAVGGPYLGLAFADRPPDVLRGTVSAAFAVGIVMSLVAVAVAGRLSQDDVTLGIALMPATGVGLALGRGVGRRLRTARLRPAVLGVAAGAGLFALARGLA